MAMNGSSGQVVASKVLTESSPCPACGQYALIARQNYLMSTRASVTLPSGAEQLPMAAIDMFWLCLWCLYREFRAPSKGEKRWTLRATAGPGADRSPVRQEPGGAAAIGTEALDMAAGMQQASIPSPEYLANEGLGDVWEPVEVPEGLR